MIKSINPDSLFNNLSEHKLAPIESWNPVYCGEIDICIHRNGSWSYNGSIINRIALVKLFARVIKRESNDYFLVTPVEKVKIKVEAEPFTTVMVELRTSGIQSLAFKTNIDEIIIANNDHPIIVTDDEDGHPYPRLHIRNNLHALIGRSDFYQLVNWATSNETLDNSKKICTIKSENIDFTLGTY